MSAAWCDTSGELGNNLNASIFMPVPRVCPVVRNVLPTILSQRENLGYPAWVDDPSYDYLISIFTTRYANGVHSISITSSLTTSRSRDLPVNSRKRHGGGRSPLGHHGMAWQSNTSSRDQSNWARLLVWETRPGRRVLGLSRTTCLGRVVRV